MRKEYQFPNNIPASAANESFFKVTQVEKTWMISWKGVQKKKSVLRSSIKSKTRVNTQVLVRPL